MQPNGISIQTLIEKALGTYLRHSVTVTASGRTDAGVHALSQIAHFDTDLFLDPLKFLYACNALLPKEIRLLEVDPVEKDFHARYSALSKIYRYHLQTGSFQDPFQRNYQWHIRGKCNSNLFPLMASYLIGTHDFASFANEGHLGAAAKNSIRTLKRLDVFEEDAGIILEFEANGFLYKMVRNIVGTFVDIAQGKMLPSEIPAILEGKNRRLAGRCAPPHGLFLKEVHYPKKDNEEPLV